MKWGGPEQVAEAARQVQELAKESVARALSALRRTLREVPSSLIRNRAPLGPYSRTMPRALWGF